MPFVRSISGLRATVDDNSLNDDIVRDYCRAYSQIIPEGEIIIGRDGRPSGEHIQDVAVEALSDSGRDVHIAGIVPTPTVELLVEKSGAAGGIIITASHNPAQWNGLKFLNSDGVFLDADKNNELWNIVDNNLFQSHDRQGKIKEIDNALDLHLESILNIPILRDNIDKIKGMKLKAVVDAVNASGSKFVPQMLNKLGVEVIPLFCDGTGVFPHTPEPLPQNLTELAAAVRKNNADIGIAVDPDADRLVLIDGNGEPIGEELTVSLAVESVLSLEKENKNNNVVVNLSTTRVVEDIAEKFNAKVFRSPVGEINVVNKMRETNAVIGGEGSGGVIYPACHYGRDSLVGIALILSLMAVREMTLKELANELPKYDIVKVKQEFTSNVKQLVYKIAEEFKDYKINLDDGIRVDFDKSWVQVRASNTEPIIRIIAEAPTSEETEQLIENIQKFLL